MNTFEVAILRILVKRHDPLKLFTLVNGFPDDCEDDVLAAISSLKLGGFITISDYQLNGYVSIAKDRRMEILQIVNPGNFTPKAVPVQPAVSEEKSSARRILPQIRTIAIASVFIFALAAVIIPSLAASTTNDSGIVAHHHNLDHWHVYGASGSVSNTEHPTSAMFLTWQNCTQKQQS